MKFIRLTEVCDSKVDYGILAVSSLTGPEPSTQIVLKELEIAKQAVSRTIDEWQVDDVIERLKVNTGWDIHFIYVDAVARI